MIRKVWDKPLHQRKVWRNMPISSKIIYYMQPFVTHLVDTWMQSLPFPTLLKMISSIVLSVFILLPFIYPTVVLICYYIAVQYVVQSNWDICLPKQLDLLGFFQHLYTYKVENDNYELFLYLYMERWRILGTAIASSIDYIRLALCLLFEITE